jgi:hypothetical protein
LQFHGVKLGRSSQAPRCIRPSAPIIQRLRLGASPSKQYGRHSSGPEQPSSPLKNCSPWREFADSVFYHESAEAAHAWRIF